MRTPFGKSLRIATLAAALAAGLVATPSRAESTDLPVPLITQNNLTPLGNLGPIRVRPVGQGQFQPLTGDLTARQNPNRTVGAGPSSCPSAGCVVLAVNPAAGDGHTHYHPDTTTIHVSERNGFVVGDTILIGYTSCNWQNMHVNLRCHGNNFTEQPIGEVNYIVSGVGTGITGPGPVTLAFGLGTHTDYFGQPVAFPEGARVTKLPTLYPGQYMRIEIPDVSLRNGLAAEAGVRAWLLAPGFDETAAESYIPLPPRTSGCIPGINCEHVIPATGTGTTFFYMPRLGLANVGRSFNATTSDDWYSIVISSRNTLTNAILADGVYRFKLNAITFGMIDCDKNGTLDGTFCVQPEEQLPGLAVTITGRLADNSSTPALDRNVEDVLVRAVFQKPSGETFVRTDHTCYDSVAGSGDPCQARVPTRIGTHHGEFTVRAGALQCFNMVGPGFCGGTPAEWILNDIGHFSETFETGTYFVTMSPALAQNLKIQPVIDRTVTFDILLPLP